MDIFNKKRVKELETKVDDQRNEIDRLRDDLVYAQKKFEALQKATTNTPEGCKIGPYCGACEFGKTFCIDEYKHAAIYICAKGESCKNFIQKEVE